MLNSNLHFQQHILTGFARLKQQNHWSVNKFSSSPEAAAGEFCFIRLPLFVMLLSPSHVKDFPLHQSQTMRSNSQVKSRWTLSFLTSESFIIGDTHSDPISPGSIFSSYARRNNRTRLVGQQFSLNYNQLELSKLREHWRSFFRISEHEKALHPRGYCKATF